MFIVQIDTDDVSEEELAALDEVVETMSLGEASDKAVYKLVVDLDEAISEVFDPERFEGAPIEPTTITPEGWHEKKAFKDYEAFNEYRKSCKNHRLA